MKITEKNYNIIKQYQEVFLMSIKNLKITDVIINPFRNSNGKLKAIVKIVLNDSLILTNLRIFEGLNGLFVSYPIEFNQKGEEFRQIFYPVSRGFREYIEEEILREYSKVTGVKQ